MSLINWKADPEPTPLDRERDITRVLKAADAIGPVTKQAVIEQFGKPLRPVGPRDFNNLADQIDQIDMQIENCTQGLVELRKQRDLLVAELGGSCDAYIESAKRLRERYVGDANGKQTEKADGQDHPKQPKRRVQARDK